MKKGVSSGKERRYAAAWETILLIVLPLISLALAALILVPAVKNYLQHERDRAAAMAYEEEEAPLRLRVETRNPEPFYDLSDPFFGWRQENGDLYYIGDDGRPLTGLQRIDGRLYYFAPDGRKASALGVDVSFYNEDVNWREVREQGIDFVIVRLGGRGWSTGLLYGDIRTAQYLHNAHEAGLRVGAYFYSTAGSESEAAEEARAALRVLEGQTLELPVFIDVEESGEYPDGRSDVLTRDERTRVIEAFCRVVEAGGYEAGVYSGHYFYNTSMHVKAFGNRMIWIANYTASEMDRVPDFEHGYEIWQFTDSGQVKGITGYSDLNVIF